MARFGLNGYQCEMVASEDQTSYELKAWDDSAPELSASLTIKPEQLDPQWPPYSREQTEVLFAPLFEELDGKRDELESEAAHAKVDAQLAQNKADRDNARTHAQIVADADKANGANEDEASDEETDTAEDKG